MPWSLVDGLCQELEPNGHPATPWQCQSDKEWGHNSNHHRLLGSDLCPASVDGPESLSAAWERSRACGAQHRALRQVCAWLVRVRVALPQAFADGSQVDQRFSFAGMAMAPGAASGGAD